MGEILFGVVCFGIIAAVSVILYREDKKADKDREKKDDTNIR